MRDILDPVDRWLGTPGAAFVFGNKRPVALDDTLTAVPGLWLYDTGAGTPVQSWQWKLGGNDIPGATGANHTVLAGQIGPGLSVTQTQTDTYGQRAAQSLPVGLGFQPSDDPSLIGLWDGADTATITATTSAVSA